MRVFFALLLIVALLTFVFAEAYATAEIQTELEGGPYFEARPVEPPKIDNKPVAIMPEEPVRLVIDDEEGEDHKGKGGRIGPENTPATRKREFHRKMMYR